MSDYPGIDAILATKSMRSFAFLAGCSPMTARKIALARLEANQPNEDGQVRVYKTEGADGKLRPARRYNTLARDAKIVYLRSEGISIRAIATEVGCSAGTVHRVLKASNTEEPAADQQTGGWVVRIYEDNGAYTLYRDGATYPTRDEARGAVRADLGRMPHTHKAVQL